MMKMLTRFNHHHQRSGKKSDDVTLLFSRKFVFKSGDNDDDDDVYESFSLDDPLRNVLDDDSMFGEFFHRAPREERERFVRESGRDEKRKHI